MAASELVQARIDGAIKKEAAAVLATIGLTVSDAVRLMLTRVANDHALPFDPLIPNSTTIAAMKAARAGELETVTPAQLQTVIKGAPVGDEAPKQRIGFLKGKLRVPDDFDTLGGDEIADMFGL